MTSEQNTTQPRFKLSWNNTILIPTRMIGQGAYGNVYACYDKNNP
jgi:hypothetical protein